MAKAYGTAFLKRRVLYIRIGFMLVLLEFIVLSYITKKWQNKVSFVGKFLKYKQILIFISYVVCLLEKINIFKYSFCCCVCLSTNITNPDAYVIKPNICKFDHFLPEDNSFENFNAPSG